jgi:hypothetical protein
MRTRVRTAIAALTVVVGVAACSTGNDNAARSDTGLGAGTAGGTSAGTISPAGTAGAAGSSSGAAGAMSTTGATVGPTTGTTGAMTHADSLRADSARRATTTTPRP